MQTIKKLEKMQAKIIKPYMYFNKGYGWILRSLGKTVTKGEKKLLLELHKLQKETDTIEINYKTIAKNVKFSMRHTQRLMSQLHEKGFIKIKTPTYSERRATRKTNEYDFLYHNSYEGKDN